mgnify:CR=1 FL=1
MNLKEWIKTAEHPEIIRSGRRTLSLEIRSDGRLIVRAPYAASQTEIRRFVRNNHAWIIRKIDEIEKRMKQAEKAEPISAEECRELARQAVKELPPRLEAFAKVMGVSYGRVKIRNQKTRWGSCSVKGNLNFNCLLMLMPREIQDYVLVHELAHLREMNHSPRFWAIVEGVLPDYRERRKWLKQNGGVIMERMRNG